MIYVAGPVLRDKSTSWVSDCYSIIEDVVRYRSDLRASMHYADFKLETLHPKEFAAEITSRIREADNVIAVFLPGDQSTPIECILAALAKKRVLIINGGGGT